MYLYTYVHIYIYIYICICIYTYIYICILVYISHTCQGTFAAYFYLYCYILLCVLLQTFFCRYICTCVHIYTCVYKHVYVYIQISTKSDAMTAVPGYIPVYRYICTCVHTYICMYKHIYIQISTKSDAMSAALFEALDIKCSGTVSLNVLQVSPSLSPPPSPDVSHSLRFSGTHACYLFHSSWAGAGSLSLLPVSFSLSLLLSLSLSPSLSLPASPSFAYACFVSFQVLWRREPQIAVSCSHSLSLALIGILSFLCAWVLCLDSSPRAQ